MDATAALSDRVADAIPTAVLAAGVLVALEVWSGGSTAPAHLVASFALRAVVILVGIVVFEAAWDRAFGDD